MPHKILYLSGPISLNGTATPSDIATYKRAFKEAADKFRRMGYEVISPIECPEQKTWGDYMRVCIGYVLQSDAVICLPRWGFSRGSVFEVLVANTINLPVYEYSEFF